MIGPLCAGVFTFGVLLLLSGLIADELNWKIHVGVLVIGVVFGVAIGLLERMAR